jgi:hypothetical protein
MLYQGFLIVRVILACWVFQGSPVLCTIYILLKLEKGVFYAPESVFQMCLRKMCILLPWIQ